MPDSTDYEYNEEETAKARKVLKEMIGDDNHCRQPTASGYGGHEIYVLLSAEANARYHLDRIIKELPEGLGGFITDLWRNCTTARQELRKEREFANEVRESREKVRLANQRVEYLETRLKETTSERDDYRRWLDEMKADKEKSGEA